MVGDDLHLKEIAIVGGGTAGWMAASVLARAVWGTGCTVHVVESPEIGTVGVGEATIPPILDFLKFLQIDEADFIRHTKATYKLGIKFLDWHHPGHTYWHPFGTFGTTIDRRPFFHYWHQAKAKGTPLRFNDFSLCAALGDENRYLPPDPASRGPQGGLRYALHFDAGLVAKYLRAYAERFGAKRIEKTVAGVTKRADGFLDGLQFTDGTALQADFFIDCSGFRGLLIEQALEAGYIDWTHWLPCDRAVAMPTAFTAARAPYTRSLARPAGWQWRIPLQHRAGNGYVFSSAAISDDAAAEDLIATVGEPKLAEPRILRFATGRRKLFWSRNCVALGLASGFLEPLESTSIHCVTSGLYRLLEHFPDRSFDPANTALYNARMIEEFESIRDFIVLHYCTTARTDSELWRYCGSMTLPDSLQAKVELYKGTGRAMPKPGELFTDLSWFYIFDGMEVAPRRYDPLADAVEPAQVARILDAMRAATREAARTAPSHDSYFPAPEPVPA